MKNENENFKIEWINDPVEDLINFYENSIRRKSVYVFLCWDLCEKYKPK